jgi:murein tripeptide amidase MpaA
MIVVRVAMTYTHVQVNPQSFPTWASMYPLINRRFEVERRFRELGGRYLVLVRYRDHNQPVLIHNEWVYNSAQIDQSQVVWARELDEEHNRRLLDYFKDRQVWLVNPDDASLVRLR